MRPRRILAVIFLIGNLYGRAQFASAFQHEKMADSIIRLFNTQQFTGIYDLTDTYFKTNIAKAELVDLLQNGLYGLYGSVKDREKLKEEKDFFSYLLVFDGTKIQMNLAVDENKKVVYLEFLPYREIPMLKRSNYFSDNKNQTRLDSLVNRTVKEYMQSPQNCGLSIGVTLNGQHYFYNYGELKRDSKTACSPQTLYETGSVTKTFCGTLFAKAIVEGKIKPDDELSKFLPGKYPGLSLNGQSVLLKHLATHSSGLPAIPDNFRDQPGFDSLNPYKNYTKEMLYNYLKTVKLESEPGTEFLYSNMGMALLGLALEEVYGRSFEELVKEKICVQNDMQNTGVQLTAEQEKMFAQGYNFSGSATPHWNLGVFNAAGALKSNTSDMLKFLDYNFREEDKSLDLAQHPAFSGRLTVGFSWFIKKTKQLNTLFWHNGGTEGFRSFAGFIKEKKCSVVVLSNSAMDVDFIAIAILDFLQQ